MKKSTIIVVTLVVALAMLFQPVSVKAAETVDLSNCIKNDTYEAEDGIIYIIKDDIIYFLCPELGITSPMQYEKGVIDVITSGSGSNTRITGYITQQGVQPLITKEELIFLFGLSKITLEPNQEIEEVKVYTYQNKYLTFYDGKVILEQDDKTYDVTQGHKATSALFSYDEIVYFVEEDRIYLFCPELNIKAPMVYEGGVLEILTSGSGSNTRITGYITQQGVQPLITKAELMFLYGMVKMPLKAEEITDQEEVVAPVTIKVENTSTKEEYSSKTEGKYKYLINKNGDIVDKIEIGKSFFIYGEKTYKNVSMVFFDKEGNVVFLKKSGKLRIIDTKTGKVRTIKKSGVKGLTYNSKKIATKYILANGKKKSL